MNVNGSFGGIAAGCLHQFSCPLHRNPAHIHHQRHCSSIGHGSVGVGVGKNNYIHQAATVAVGVMFFLCDSVCLSTRPKLPTKMASTHCVGPVCRNGCTMKSVQLAVLKEMCLSNSHALFLKKTMRTFCRRRVRWSIRCCQTGHRSRPFGRQLRGQTRRGRRCGRGYPV